MLKTVFRILINLLSRVFKTDNISLKFPVSIKAIIIDDNRVLCLKNERDEWDFPGGKIKINEDIEDCLLREVKEETNLNIKNLKSLKPMNLKFNGVQVIVFLFSAEISCDSPIILSYEHTDYSFFLKSEIKDLNMPQYYKNIIVTLI